MWKKVWGLEVQPKIRNFLWRAIRNLIPTMVNLRHWKIITNDICEYYQIEPEDVVHALWSCLLLSTMWNQDSEWSFRSTLHVVSFREVVEHIMEVGVDLDLFATIIKTV